MRSRAAQLNKVDLDQAIPAAITDVADEELVERTRRGDRRAFAELWRRHYRSGIAVARSFSTLDADDLVSESFARIYKRTLEGGGPRGAFRPYLYTTIRNLASTWGTASAKSINVDEFDELEPTESAEEPVARSLDRTLTVQAYQSLPVRWQTVLWYTEVEGLDPHEVAPILGLSANSVAALSYRAREGLRKAWLQAHVSDASASGTCAWVMERVGEHARHSLTQRETAKLESHLAVCSKCSTVSEEVDDVGSRLAMVMIPLLLGGVVGGSLLAAASASTGSAAFAASATGVGSAASAIPALPASIGAGAAASSSLSTIAAIAASTIVVAGVGAGVGLVGTNEQPKPAAAGATSQAGALADPLGVDAKARSVSSTALPRKIDSVDPASTSLPIVQPTVAPTTEPTTAPTTGPTTPPDTSTDTSTRSTAQASTGTADSDTKSTPESAGKTVTKVVTTTTGTVDTVTKAATGTVGSVVGSTTDTVDKVVDTVVPPGPLNSTIDSVTNTVDATVGTVTGTADTTVGAATGVVGGLVGGLLGH